MLKYQMLNIFILAFILLNSNNLSFQAEYFQEFYNYDEEYRDGYENKTLIEYSDVPKFFSASYLAYIITSFLPHSNNEEMFKYIVNGECFQRYLVSYTETNDNSDIMNIIRFSGKSYPDFGNEAGCLKENNSFILFYIQFPDGITDLDTYNGSFNLLPFISSSYSFYGLCIIFWYVIS